MVIVFKQAIDEKTTITVKSFARDDSVGEGSIHKNKESPYCAACNDIDKQLSKLR